VNINLRLLQHLTHEWVGTPVDDTKLVRILNAAGQRPPLIWCFNAQHEFPILAAGLGADQPVIGIRSLHLVERNGRLRYGKDELVASLYMNAMRSALDLDECFVGGNCQGANVAIHTAFNLLKSGKNVRALITMEAQSPLPFPGRVGMIFGARSQMFNPFLRGETPQARWNMLFTDPVVEIVPGTHGEYFNPDNFPALCKAIARIIDLSSDSGAVAMASVDVSLDLIEPPSSLKAGSKSHIRFLVTTAIAGDPKEVGQLVAGFLWTSAEHGPVEVAETQPLPLRPGGSADMLTAVIEAPLQAGDWYLHAFACRKNAGPVSWARNHTPKCIVQVE
jgi:hypothetical protein